MRSRSTFLLGGARSGKSRLAEELAQVVATTHCLRVTAVVTAEPIDSEMEDRIAHHQAQRPTGWSTLEAPYDLVEAVIDQPPGTVVVVDCVTVWLSNLLVRGDTADDIEEQGLALANALMARPDPTVVVSNELGLGLVPADPVSRSFRDIQGRVNQTLARHLDRSFFVVAGLLLPLQPVGSLTEPLRDSTGS